MTSHLFESFAQMICDIPTKGMLKAIELERQMLKNDLLYKRTADKEAASIFNFCEFIKAVEDQDCLAPVVLPADHVVGYRKILNRLIEAGELPVVAQKQFELTFASPAGRP